MNGTWVCGMELTKIQQNSLKEKKKKPVAKLVSPVSLEQEWTVSWPGYPVR